MIDDKTKNLALPLPHADNTLDQDLPRIREAFGLLDAELSAVQADARDMANGQAAKISAALEGHNAQSGTHATLFADVWKALQLLLTWSGGNADSKTTGILPVAQGGTGQTSAAAIRNSLGLGNTTGALPVANGGTGQTSAAAIRNSLGLGNTTGVLPVANGGTGVNTIANLKTALGITNGAGGGFNTRAVLTSGTSYNPPVTGWYKVTIIGGGGGGGGGGTGGSEPNGGANYWGGGGGGGGASGSVIVAYQKLTQGVAVSYSIGAAGATGNIGTALNGTVGGNTVFNGVTGLGGPGGNGGYSSNTTSWGGRGGIGRPGGGSGGNGASGGVAYSVNLGSPGVGGVGGVNGTGYGSGRGGRWGNYSNNTQIGIGYAIDGGDNVNGAVILEYCNPAI